MEIVDALNIQEESEIQENVVVVVIVVVVGFVVVFLVIDVNVFVQLVLFY